MVESISGYGDLPLTITRVELARIWVKAGGLGWWVKFMVWMDTPKLKDGKVIELNDIQKSI